MLAAQIRHIHESVFLFAAEGLANLVTQVIDQLSLILASTSSCHFQDDFEVGRMYPDLTRIKEVSIKIATKVAEEAYKEGMAATYPEPEDKEAHIRCCSTTVNMLCTFYS